MAKFSVEGRGEFRDVEARDWMEALTLALGASAQGKAGSLSVDLDPEGTLTVRFEDGQEPLVIRPEQALAVAVRVARTLPPQTGESSWDAPEPSESEAWSAAEDLGRASLEQLDEAAATLGTLTSPVDLAEEALALLLRFVPAEAGSVLLRTLGNELEFVAASGPRATNLVGLRMPADVGLAGVCLHSRAALRVREVSWDHRHLDAVDRATGYQTHSLLATPLRGSHGVHGCVELLNPFGTQAFAEWHLEAAQIVASHLAARLDTL